MNWQSFTIFNPMVLLSLAAAIGPGSSHDSSITPKGLLPQPKPAEGVPRVQASWVYFNIKVRVLVRLMSPRAFSSRQGVGVLREAVQFKLAHGSDRVGLGYCVKSKRPGAVTRPAGRIAGTGVPALFGASPKVPPAWVGSGSVRPATGKPALLLPPVLPGQAAMALKSPTRSPIVGTWPLRAIPSMRLFHSWDQKKKILSFFTGPPMV